MDMSAAFRKAICDWLPEVRISIDDFHIIQCANQMINAVRRHRLPELSDRRGKMGDPAYEYRKLLTGISRSSPISRLIDSGIFWIQMHSSVLIMP
jgi:transposase